MRSCFEQVKGSEVEKLKSSGPFNRSTVQLFTLSTLLCACLATSAFAEFEGREILRRPDMCNVDTVDTVAWYAQESVRLGVEPWRCGQRVAIPQGATAAWVVADEGGTNWIVRYDGAPSSNKCAFALGAGEGALPAGHDYMGYVSLLHGTNILGVLDRFEVRVMGQAADGGSEISPEGGCWGSLLERMAEAEAGIATNAANLDAHAADTNNPHGVTAEQAGALPLSGGTLTATLTLDNGLTSGNTPGIEFRQGTLGDPFPDWRISESYDNLSFDLRTHTTGADWANMARITPSGRLYATSFAGDGSSLTVNSTNLQTWLPALDARIDSLYGECRGGYKWADYFSVEGVEAGALAGAVTNTATATQTVYNVSVGTVESEVLKGWKINTDVIRQSDWDAGGVQWAVTEADGLVRYTDPLSGGSAIRQLRPSDFVVNGDIVGFVDGFSGDVDSATVRGTLGEYTQELTLEFDASKQAATSTVRRFLGPAAGSLLAACWSNVLGAASNGYAASPRKDVGLRTWPNGYGGRTNHVEAGWNTNFWGQGLGDFSCVSYHTEGPPAKAGEGAAYGVYMPITMVTPRHGIVANHWKPAVGSNVYWVSRSGAILTNKVVSYKNIRGDLTVARLDHAFETNDIAPAKLLRSGWHGFLYGATNWANGLFGVPVVGFDCAERGYLMNWTPMALSQGRNGTVGDDAFFILQGGGGYGFPFFRVEAVGGDSGSPVFWPVDGETVLLGCFQSPRGGPMPEKSEVDAAIEAWGDAERCVDYDLQSGGWSNPEIPAAPGQ